VGKDILVNGVQIYKDINGCVADYNNQSWEDFGKKLGNALMLILIGNNQSVIADEITYVAQSTFDVKALI